jgi:membrane-associated phospholipid phosphatase
MEYLSRIKSEWLTFAESKARRIEFLFSATLITTIMFCLLFYLRYNETRAGVVLQDPLIAMIPPADLSNLTFVLIYSGIVSTVIMLLTHPMRLTIGFQIYAVYAALRLLGMWLVPLEPPAGFIPLVDPLMAWAHTGQQLNKDLFFSGHTATMFICYLILPPGWGRPIFLVGVVVMGVCLIVQRVHYSVDVLSAPFYCYGAMGLVMRVRRLCGLKGDMNA